MLISFDLSAAFDPFDHNILNDRFNFVFVIEGLALKWLLITHRKMQFVKLATHTVSLSIVFRKDQSLDPFFSQHTYRPLVVLSTIPT